MQRTVRTARGVRRRIAVLLDGSAAARRAVNHALERARRDRLEVVLVGLEPALLHRLPPALARLVIPSRATAAGRTREARAILEMNRVPCRIAGASGAPAAAIADVMRAHRCMEIVMAEHDWTRELASAVAANSRRRVTVI